MRKQISTHIQQCDTCQRYRQKPTNRAPLMPIAAPAGAFQRLGIDIIGPLPVTSWGRRYILTIEDHLTKWPEAFAIETANAQTIIRILYDEVFSRHSVPKEIITDQGREFVNKAMKAFASSFKIKLWPTTAYHPQANGLTEQMNQTIKWGLSRTRDQLNWDIYLLAILFSIYTSKVTATQQTPFYLVYG